MGRFDLERIPCPKCNGTGKDPKSAPDRVQNVMAMESDIAVKPAAEFIWKNVLTNTSIKAIVV